MTLSDLVILLDKEPYDPLVLLALADSLEEEGQSGLANGYRNAYWQVITPYKLVEDGGPIPSCRWAFCDQINRNSCSIPADLFPCVFEQSASFGKSYCSMAYFAKRSDALSAYARAWETVRFSKLATPLV